MQHALIFDMDGLLVDSEPFWQSAEMEIFGSLGVPLTVERCRETQGLRAAEVVAHWHRLHPWSGEPLAAVTERLVERVAVLIEEQGEPLPGAMAAVRLAQARGFRTALASSSPYPNIRAVLRRLRLVDAFEVVRSAEDEAHGKPHPAVYLRTAELLGVPPHRCAALEDSVNGVISAKAARMRCIAVPHPSVRLDPRFGIADVILDSLEDMSDDVLRRALGLE
jgi:mannitol-1-/sugar-/sorbitol-6-/2-deoxyglucose-6-phosphatase